MSDDAPSLHNFITAVAPPTTGHCRICNAVAEAQMFHKIGSTDNAETSTFGLGDPTASKVKIKSSVGILSANLEWDAVERDVSSKILYRMLADELAEGL